MREWEKSAPAAGRREWATRALRSVAGVDLNPYATAIARFRLVLAAFEEAGITSLVGAPVFVPNVTTADALLGGLDAPMSGKNIQTEFGGGTWTGSALFEFENPEEGPTNPWAAVSRGCRQSARHYAKGPNAECRVSTALFDLSPAWYSLVAPFVQRFFEVSVEGGFVGAIVANSFMKREFGRKLISSFLPTVDLLSIYDTSGAFIPGHATPTVILVGRMRKPTHNTVTAAMSKRGEPGRPSDPKRGLVWSTIAAHGDRVGHEDDFISVSEVTRDSLAHHPWSLGGGGAADLKILLEKRATHTVGDFAQEIGRTTHTGEDEIFYLTHSAADTFGLADRVRRIWGGRQGLHSLAFRRGSLSL